MLKPQRCLIWVPLACALAGSPALGGPSAAPYYSRGIRDYNRGAFAAAAASLEKAADADPSDFFSAYYLGSARYALGRVAEARAAFEAARALKPEDAGCLFSLGLCDLSLGDCAGAIALFEKAAAADPRYRPQAAYHCGVALARLDRPGEARTRFRLVMEEEGTPAELYAACRRNLAALRRTAEKRWFFSCTARYEYDSNVMLAPDNTALTDVSGEGDFRFLTTGDLRIVPVRWKKFELDTEYLFSQSVQNRLGDFNMQGHSLSNTAILKTDPIHPFAGYEYDYFFLDDNKESFLRTNAILAGFNVYPCANAITQFNYRWADDHFFSIPEAGDYDRNARNNSAGVTQYLFFGPEANDFAGLGFAFDRNAAEGDAYYYDGYRFYGELSKRLFAGLTLDTTAEYYYRKFPRDSERDRDNRQTYTVTLSRALNEFLEAGLSYYYSANDSREDFFTYDRNIFTLYCAANF